MLGDNAMGHAGYHGFLTWQLRHAKNTNADPSSQASLAFCITLHACSFLETQVVETHKRLVQFQQLGFSRRLTMLLAKLAREEIPDADFRYTSATGQRDLNGSISS